MTYITVAEKTHERWHRKPIIVHKDFNWYIAEFTNIQQLEKFPQTLGFTYKLENEKDTQWCGLLKEYSVSHNFKDSYFGKKEDLPAGSSHIKALSNGSIVDCYFYNDGNTITIYRPNPNCKDIYNPMDVSTHVAYQKIYGVY